MIGKKLESQMDILFFLKERTKFIRFYYECAEKPFGDTIWKIEAGEAPSDQPLDHEYVDGEPPFMEEWSNANLALNILGCSCVSMLSASLQLYFKTWETELGIQWQPKEREKAFKTGFIQGCKECFGDVLKLSWSDCPANFELLEQVVLARNRDQHPERITSMSVAHTKSDWEKRANLHFLNDFGRAIAADPEMAAITWLIPEVHVSRKALFVAIAQVEALAEWLEPRMIAARYPRRLFEPRNSAPHLVNFLYFNRCGITESTPSRRFLSSS